MRLLLTSHLFLPEHSGGTEQLTYSVASELQRRGHEVLVCTGHPKGSDRCEQERSSSDTYEDLHIHRYRRATGANATLIGDYRDPDCDRWFSEMLQRFSPDLVHFFHLGNLSGTLIDVCMAAGIPRVMTPTDFWLICPNCQLRLPDHSLCPGPDPSSSNCIRHAVADTQPKLLAAAFQHLPDAAVSRLIAQLQHRESISGWPLVQKVTALAGRARFLRERMNRLDRVIAPTQLMQERLIANGLDADRLTLRHYGLRDLPPVPHVANRHGRLRIGFIGELREHKGVHVLLQALRSLPPEPPLELRIYGRPDVDPIYQNHLQKIAGDDRRIRFCGTFANAEIASVFSELDLLVVPSIWYENTPLVLYSAQAARCAVIASDLGGMAEVVEHGRNGLLFAAGDWKALAQHLQGLAQDRAWLARLSAGTKPPKGIGQYVDELIEIYDEVLDSRQGQR